MNLMASQKQRLAIQKASNWFEYSIQFCEQIFNKYLSKTIQLRYGHCS